MEISIDSSELNNDQLDSLTEFLRTNNLEYCYNSMGIDFHLPLGLFESFYWWFSVKINELQ